MCEVGDIVKIYAPLAGYYKYHLCVKKRTSTHPAYFLFLNSDPSYEQLYVMDCSRLSFLPSSKTGKTAFSFSMVPKYTEKQLKLFKAEVLGKIDNVLAKALLAHAYTVTLLNQEERKLVIDGLASIK